MSDRPVIITAAPRPSPVVLEAVGDLVEFRGASDPSPATIVREGQGAIGLIPGNQYMYGAEVFDGIPTLQFVACSSSGVDYIDLDAATERGIPVTHAAGAGHVPVAEYVISTMVFLMKRLGEASALLRSGQLAGKQPWIPVQQTLGRDATGKTLGIIGLGYIGMEVARMAKAALDMRVLGYDPYVDEARFTQAGIRRADIEEILRTADVVTLHVPLNPRTRHLIGKAELAMMRKEAILINAARGPIVDEMALADALRERRIAGAAVDTYEQEPPPADHPLFDLPNVIVTPHFAGVTQESLVKLQQAAADAIRAMVQGERPAHIANPEAWPPKRRPG